MSFLRLRSIQLKQSNCKGKKVQKTENLIEANSFQHIYHIACFQFQETSRLNTLVRSILNETITK